MKYVQADIPLQTNYFQPMQVCSILEKQNRKVYKFKEVTLIASEISIAA